MKTFAAAVLAWLLAMNLFAGLLPQRVLYVGQRGEDFAPFLKQHFAKVKAVTREQFAVAQAKDFDVVLLDWPQSGTTDGAWLGACPLGKRDEWNKSTVLLGSAGLNLAVAWKLKGGSGCTCLAPVAYNLRDHLIFKSPMPVDIRATINIPTPEQFSGELKTPTIAVLPLEDGITDYHNVINQHERGWSTHYYEFADMPEVEVFSGGINEQTPRSAAFWRQGNLLHFGFEQTPTELNASGRAMLVNGIVYISHFTEDRPIDITQSIFGPDKIAITRKRARGYLARFANEVPEVFSAATLATFDWRDTNVAQNWFKEAQPWLHPNAGNLLEIDEQAKALGITFDDPLFLPKTIAALRDDKTKAAAVTLLNRYVHQPLGPDAGAEAWDAWWKENSPYIFYSELGGYQWYIDPLAKKRGIPTKDLRGPARADTDKPFSS